MIRGGKNLQHLVLLCVLFAAGGAAAKGHQEQHDIDIRITDAEQALKELAAQTASLLLFPFDLAENLRVNPVNGRYTIEQALDALLADSGLDGVLSNHRVISVTRANKPDNGDQNMQTVTKKPLIRRIVAGLTGALFATSGTGAIATEDADENLTIEEIIVTATYRETDLLDTPLSVTALDENTLLEKGVLNLQSLYQNVPGMNYSLKSNSYSNISIRGLTPPGGGGAVVGVYIDDIPITDSNDGGGSQQLGAIYDVQRVEVLKGPQGTLYGEGNMGGALRYITNNPDPSTFDSSFRVQSHTEKESDGYGYIINGMVNIPLEEDVLALRLSGQYRDDPGFMDIVAPRSEKDVNDTQEHALRAKLAWYVTPEVTINATVNHYESKYGGPSISNVPYGNTDSTSLKYEQQFGNGGEMEDTTYNLSLHWDLPWAQLLVSSSYYDRDIRFNEETSARFRANVEGLAILFALPEFAPGFPNVYYVPGFPFPYPGPVVEAWGGGDGFLRRRTERNTNEIRLVSTSDGPLQWNAGLYHKDDHPLNGDVNAPGFENVILTPGWVGFEQAFVDFIPGSETERENIETAAYGEVSYDLTPQWNVLLGVRFSNVTAEQIDGGFPMVDDSFVSPKATLTFRPSEDKMVYLTVAQGFRPGILNGGATSSITNLTPLAAVPGVQEQIDFLNSVVTVAGDEIFNYELGYKATLNDGRLKLAASVYYLDWKDTLTANRYTTLIGDTIYTDNAGAAHSKGLELEIDAQITDNLSLQFSGAWNTEAEMDSFADGLWTDINGNNIVVGPGNRLANSPEFTGNIGLNYRFYTGDYTGNARADWYHVDKQFTNVSNEITTPEYSMLNIRLTMTRPGGAWSASLFGRNLTNEEIIYENNEVGQIYGPSRTFGVEVSWNLPQ